MKQIVLAMVFVLLAGAMAAQAQSVPPLVNYQGLLTDAAGKPQTGTKKLEFNLYDAATGGNKVWGPQVFETVPLVNGMFNVILGTTDAGGKSIADAFSAKDRYLGMKVDGGTELAPRQQILSTPFAINAQNALQANVAKTVKGDNLYVDSESGNVGIGTASPNAKLDVAGSVKADTFIGLFREYNKVLTWKITPPTTTEGLRYNDIDLGLDNTNAKYLIASVFMWCDQDDHVNHIFGYSLPSAATWQGGSADYWNYVESDSNTYVVVMNGGEGGRDPYGNHEVIVIPLKNNHRMDVLFANGYTRGTHYIKLRAIAYIE